jgi:hypothetical protein
MGKHTREHQLLLIAVWKLAANVVDYRKPGAQPKKTRSEVSRLEKYHELYEILDSDTMQRFDALGYKYRKDKETFFRHPWFKDQEVNERRDWALEFARIALRLGMTKDEIRRDVYAEGPQFPMLDAVWEEARLLNKVIEDFDRELLEKFTKEVYPPERYSH